MERWECLECVVGHTRLLVPVRTLERVAEYALLPPPPLSEPWVSGLGQLGDRVFVSLALAGRRPGGAARKGLLLRGSEDVFAVEVERTGGLVFLQPGEPLAEGPWPCPPTWLRQGLLEGETVLCLDAGAVWARLLTEVGAA